MIQYKNKTYLSILLFMLLVFSFHTKGNNTDDTSDLDIDKTPDYDLLPYMCINSKGVTRSRLWIKGFFTSPGGVYSYYPQIFVLANSTKRYSHINRQYLSDSQPRCYLVGDIIGNSTDLAFRIDVKYYRDCTKYVIARDDPASFKVRDGHESINFRTFYTFFYNGCRFNNRGDRLDK